MTTRPTLGRYNELGVKRSPEDFKADYARQLDSDKSPLRLLYNGYRRAYAAYQPVHLVFFKLLAVLVLCSSHRTIVSSAARILEVY